MQGAAPVGDAREFDFVNVVEAPDIAAVAKVSVALSARGSTKIATLPALEIDDFLRTLDNPFGRWCRAARRCRRSVTCEMSGSTSYARLLVERSVKVQPGWQVVIRPTPLARPLIEAIAEQVARRGSFRCCCSRSSRSAARSRARRHSTCCASRRRCRSGCGRRWTR